MRLSILAKNGDAISIAIPSEHRKRGISPDLSPVSKVEPERGISRTAVYVL
jgi:hypothetical protein